MELPLYRWEKEEKSEIVRLCTKQMVPLTFGYSSQVPEEEEG